MWPKILEKKSTKLITKCQKEIQFCKLLLFFFSKILRNTKEVLPKFDQLKIRPKIYKKKTNRPNIYQNET